MRVLIIAAFFLTLQCINGEYTLQGTMGEYIGLPVSLYCSEYDYGYLRLGGITINNTPLSEKNQNAAFRQCEIQMKKIEQERKHPVHDRSGTECVLTFPGLKVNDSDVIRAVYSCYENKPSGSPAWGKPDTAGPENYETVETSKNELLSVVCKKKKEMIFIVLAKINGEIIDSKVHPDLDATKLTQVCFGQWKEKLESGSPKHKNPTCDIMNKKSYGGKLTIIYSCMADGQERKKVGKPKKYVF